MSSIDAGLRGQETQGTLAAPMQVALTQSPEAECRFQLPWDASDGGAEDAKTQHQLTVYPCPAQPALVPLIYSLPLTFAIMATFFHFAAPRRISQSLPFAPPSTTPDVKK